MYINIVAPDAIPRTIGSAGFQPAYDVAMNFHWETDETDRRQATEGAGDAARPLPRRILPLAAGLLLLALAAVTLWHTVQRRAAAVEAQVKTDVLAAHTLARHAAAQGDGELFQTLLAATDDVWSETQQERLQTGLLFDRAATLYGAQPLPGSETPPEITLDPTLRRATVEVQQSFVLTAAQGLTRTLSLRQTHIYSQTGNGWLLSPPPSAFWSPRARIEGEMVSIEYPARDEALARRLLNDLEQLLPEVCDLPGLRCPANRRVQLRLSPDPAAVTAAAAPDAMLAGDGQLVLPAPSLVGQPLDDAGYELVSRAYSARVVASLISRYVDYDCCRHGLFFSALVQRQLHHLDLQPWPLQPVDYERLMEEGLSLGDVQVLLEREPVPLSAEAGRRALALVEFLEAALPPDVPLLALEDSFDRWLANRQEPQQSFAVQWTEFLHRRARAGRAPGDGPVPNGYLYVACRPPDEAATVWRYDFAAERWRGELQYYPEPRWNVSTLAVLPGGNGYLLQEHRRNADGLPATARFTWHHNRNEITLLERAAQGDRAWIEAAFSAGDPLARFVALHAQTPSSDADQSWALFDLAQCAAGACDPLPLAGVPHWSPDGRRTLLEAPPNEETWAQPGVAAHQLLFGDERGQRAAPLARGYSAFWLDDNHYGFLRPTGNKASQDLVMVAAAYTQAAVAASSSDFQRALGDALGPEEWLQLEQVVATPAAPRRLLVLASRWPKGGAQNVTGINAYLFAVHLSADPRRVEAIEPLFHNFDYNPRLTFRQAPNGRWLAVTDNSEWTILDLDSGLRYTLGRYSGPITWSPDGRWLAERREQHLFLHAPATRTNHVLPRDLSHCWDVYWYEQGEQAGSSSLQNGKPNPIKVVEHNATDNYPVIDLQQKE
ncbi:MAG TPA: hypothetical protein VK879_10090 [Candidatus Sulfomarinibacteraceae bacterium]|nr:hypothetical protein [Candidatus Sulfomarinibacteraceae bacterium]